MEDFGSTKHGQQAVLVTGGAGFIGSHVVEGLRGMGCHVEVLDDLSAGLSANVPADVPLHVADVRSEAAVRRVFATKRFDAVVHCAAQTSVERSMLDPEGDHDVNVGGTRRLARAAKAAAVRRFVFLSSGGAIYGETDRPADERVMPAPRSHYGLHKYAAEQLLLAEGMPLAVLRPSNVYGLRQRSDAEGGVVAIFRERLLAGEPLEIHGDGRQTRDFVHVSDVIRAVLVALASDGTVIWNVASGRATTILQLAQGLAALTGCRPELRFRPPRAGDVRQSLLSPAALLATGAWGPPLTLREGLRQTALARPASREAAALAAVSA